MNSVNAFVRSTIDDLVEKRLWPVAAVLLIALIAIPVLLRNPADEAPAPVSTAVTPAVGAGDALSAFQPAVSTEGKKSSEIRKQLEGFDTKDPFKPQNMGGGGSSSSAGSVEVQSGDAAAGGGVPPTRPLRTLRRWARPEAVLPTAARATPAARPRRLRPSTTRTLRTSGSARRATSTARR